MWLTYCYVFLSSPNKALSRPDIVSQTPQLPQDSQNIVLVAPTQVGSQSGLLATISVYAGRQPPVVTLSSPPPNPQDSMASISKIESRLSVVEGDVREIKADMKHVATKLWVAVTFAVAAVGVISSFIGILWAFSRVFLPPMLRETVTAAVQQAMYH